MVRGCEESANECGSMGAMAECRKLGLMLRV